MRSEIGVTPYANYYMPYLDGEPLKDCRMADEELGCAEVYVLTAGGKRTMETRMVFGEISFRPYRDQLDPWHKPEDAAQIDREAAEFEAEVAASGWPRKR
jgi:hypothetical protein